jgi:hypothetical protein
MVIGFVIFILGLIWLPLAQMVAWFAWVLLSFFLVLIGRVGSSGFGLVTAELPWWLGAGYYLGLIGVIRGIRKMRGIKEIRGNWGWEQG